ncbi:MAG: ATP-dependent DNA helicase [Candidatus Peregrinibacteria bacterium]|nr:ATP-dependent DNA helicase [Candidatus Peregrinibacteria bacterium]
MDFNAEQKKAIDHTKGPLLIIAGAGTGKTRVITSSILHLINSGVYKASEILALTFTEKATTEMIERIDQEMPFGYEEICVKTFHSFSEQILRESGLEIGLDTSYKILTKEEQWFFFKKNLYTFELNYYRPLGNPNKFISDLLTHFSKLKDELITPEKYIEWAEKLEVKNPEEEEIRKKNLEVANAYKKYQELLIQNNYLDFGDLTMYAIRLFETRKSVLKEYRERFKYIFVDEFQDTNYAQFKLVRMLCEEHKNITVVGDDDQSIYKWRGASLSNILQFEKFFPETEKVVLIENYRSSQNILDSAYALIQNNNPDRLEVKSNITKRLHSNTGDKSLRHRKSDKVDAGESVVQHVLDNGSGRRDEKVHVHHFQYYLNEAEFVAEKIAGLQKEEGLPYSSFAILVRTNRLTNPFIDALKSAGIPYHVNDPKGLLHLPEIKDLVAVVKFLSNPYDDVSLLRILKCDVFAIPMREILSIINSPVKKHLVVALKRLAEENNEVLPGMESNFKKIYELFAHLIEFSKKNSVGLTINEFLMKSGHLEYLLQNEKFEEVYNINEFAKNVSAFEKDNQNNSVADFRSYIELLEESDYPMTYREDQVSREAVQILTTHGSKGLEFDYVFLGSMVNTRFPGTNRRDTFTVPEELTTEIYSEGDVHMQEERRLMYVAMTRARKGLHITYSDKYEGNKLWKRSVFVDEILGCESGRPESKRSLKKDTNQKVESPTRSHGSLSVEQIEYQPTVDPIESLKKLNMKATKIFDLPKFNKKRISYSQLDSFGVCPLKYNYSYLLKIPTPTSHVTNFGSSVHETLNQFYQKLIKERDLPFSVMEELYLKNWNPEGYDSVMQENTKKKKGLEMLKRYYDANSNPWTIPEFLERSFNLRIGEYMLSGRIDRIDRLPDGTYEVIDYKTGSIHSDLNIKKHLQLSIYAMVCRDLFKINVSKLSLYFLDANEKISTTRSDDQINELADEIKAKIEEIKASNFDATPNEKLCGFCDYRMICPAV